MKRIGIPAVAALLALCVLGLCAFSPRAAAAGAPLSEITLNRRGSTTVAKTRDTGKVLINPGKGFVYMGYLNPKEHGEDFVNVISMGYSRFSWNSIEPEEGKYDWEVIDNFVNIYSKQGKQFAFGVMCANTSDSGMYTTPKWVFDAGAKGRLITTENGVEQMIPDWTDKIFLEKLNDFTAALAKRYDGSPSISYIDIRSYGNWGEQHTYGIEDAWPDITAEQLKELYFEPYISAFKKTQLVAPYGKDDYDKTYEWAVEQGVTIRRDGLISYSDGEEGKFVYGKLPAIFEYSSSYIRNARESGNWQYDKVTKAVDNGAPTYLQLYEDMYESNRDFYNALANRLGYYFRFRQAAYRSEVKNGCACPMRLTFRNDGVAPFYGFASVKIGLLDKSYKLVASYPVQANPANWATGKNVYVTAFPELKVPNLKSASDEYILAVGLFADEADAKPDYMLGSTGGTADNWYVFGTVNIKKN